MEQERIWLLMGRKVSGEATMGELRELEELLQKDPDLRYKLSVLSNWPATKPDAKWEDRTEAALDKHMLRMKEVFVEENLPVKKVQKRSLKIVAALSVLVLMLGGYCTYLLVNKRLPQEGKPALAAIFTRDGSKSRAQLPDGTEVLLNGGSRLTYDQNKFNQDTREVTLEGEAFFDVAKNADKPFYIHTAKMDLKVLGTSFNIKAYNQDATTEASLITGAVEITVNDGKEHNVKLLPNQKIILEHTTNVNQVIPTKLVASYRIENIRNTQDNLIYETAWCDNYLVFDNETLATIIPRMESWYGIKIHITDSHLKKYSFTGTFKNESFREVLEALKVTTSLHWRIEGNDVFITQ
ncbi:FecR family protein [Chitinophaga silvatica]|uniref:FecR family protein n=1 Tax=Chitinophaga silvatica TaxID=2282649 RepID=A0A3E1Y2J3_9BACT|nr:FecR family protein [Chitinophaga silvatica]RFS18846.1 FecR family protein [Chitinophaga silvatica]